jgi:hypothetical protein
VGSTSAVLFMGTLECGFGIGLPQPPPFPVSEKSQSPGVHVALLMNICMVFLHTQVSVLSSRGLVLNLI